MPARPPSSSGHGHAAQSPSAKILRSLVVCRVSRTTSWLIRLVSKPPRSFKKSGAFTPAAQTTNSDSSTRPSASLIPFDITSITFELVKTCTPSFLIKSSVAKDNRGCKAGNILSAASIKLTLMSFSGSIRSSPKATTSRVVRCNSAANSTPVAPAPMMATCSCLLCIISFWLCARMQALTIFE